MTCRITTRNDGSGLKTWLRRERKERMQMERKVEMEVETMTGMLLEKTVRHAKGASRNGSRMWGSGVGG